MLATLIAWTTPYPVSYFIGVNLARLWYISGANTKTVKRNISKVMNIGIDDPRTSYICKKIYIEFAKNVVDFLKNRIIPKKQFNKNIKIEGLENLKKALDARRGAVIFTAHIGNFEWGAARIGTEGIKIWGVGLHRDNLPLDNYFERNRGNKCLKTIYANKMLHVFKILRNNEVIAIPTDLDPLKNSKIYDFFGHKAFIPSGSVQIAMAAKAPLIPSFIIRDGKYHHHQVILPPVELETEGNKEDAINKNMLKVIEILEDQIKRNIEQWVMFHDIWVE
ncbi:MAG: lysophospholipid acyltransferase family protein [Actinomycetota bacterium]|nr:lysophospholipid acyltransferase family protein [Actinomycetota bacterium]